MKTFLVAVCAVRDGDRYAWVKFERNYLKGYLGLPGGKFEDAEFLKEAAVREITEELGIETTFETFHGVVDEIVRLPEGDVRCLMFISSLAPTGPVTVTQESADGGIAAIEWLTVEELEAKRSHLVPSDYRILHDIIVGGQTGYWKCQLTRDGDGPIMLDFFERL